MMMHRNVGTYVMAMALGVVACDLPPKEVGSTLGDTDDESATSSTSSGGGGQSSTTAAESATSSTSTGTSGAPDEGTSSTSTSGPLLDVGGGTSEVGGGEVGGACDPLVQDCADGWGCYLAADAFTCQIDVSGVDGGVGDACADPAACDVGLACVSCGLADCCVVVCNTSSDDCQPGDSCVAVYADGEAPAGLETVGLCQ